MRSTYRLANLVALTCVTTAAGCLGGSDDDSVKPPPEDEIFIEADERVDSNQDGFIDANDDGNPMDGMIDTETRLFFDEKTFKKYCVVPDADSFDDLMVVNPTTGKIDVPRGTTPVDPECEADGIVTGPGRDTRIPSKWCKKSHCSPAN